MTRATRIGRDGRPAISERLFTEQVRKAAIVTGWKFYHTHNSMFSAKGYPDICLAKSGRLWFAELKTETGKVSPEQQEWIDAINEVETPFVRAIVLRPSDFDEFFEELKRI